MKQYLEKLQSSQTFYKNSVGNSKVAKSGHVYAKVKFATSTKEAYDDWRKKGGKPPNNNEEGRRRTRPVLGSRWVYAAGAPALEAHEEQALGLAKPACSTLEMASCRRAPLLRRRGDGGRVRHRRDWRATVYWRQSGYARRGREGLGGRGEFPAPPAPAPRARGAASLADPLSASAK